MQDPRPRFDLPLATILREFTTHLDVLHEIDAKSIAVVALSAYGTAAASVRSLSPVSSRVIQNGVVKTIELGLRPPFFREGDLVGRATTLIHELLHLDPKAPGALRESYRHVERSQAEVDAEAQSLVAIALERIDPVVLAPLAHDGEVLMQRWARRPIEATKARAFDDKDFFLGPVRLMTPKGGRSIWW